MNNPFDKIYHLHLLENTDRYKYITENMGKFDFNNYEIKYTTKFPLQNIIGDILYKSRILTTWNNCVKGSVLNEIIALYFIIKIAYYTNLESICIFEDDTVFDYNKVKLVEDTLNNVPDDWECLRILTTARGNITSEIESKSISDNINIQHNWQLYDKYYPSLNGSQCFALKRKAMQEYLSMCEMSSFGINQFDGQTKLCDLTNQFMYNIECNPDQILNRLTKTCKTYVCYQLITKEMEVNQSNMKVDDIYYNLDINDNFKTCICALIMDEHDYIEEWVEYYLNVYKINTIFLYEDIYSKSHKELLKKYKDRIVIKQVKDIIDKYEDYKTESTFRQYCAILDLFDNYKDKYDFCLFIDPDEYLEETPNIFYNEINKYKNNEKIKFIRYKWQLMKSNKLINKPNGKYSIVKTYTEYSNDDVSDLNRNFKCGFFFKHLGDKLIDHKYITTIPHGHCEQMNHDEIEHLPLSKIRLRHYIAKSFEEWTNRLYIKGEQTKEWTRQLDLFFHINPELNYKRDELLKEYINKEVKINNYDI